MFEVDTVRSLCQLPATDGNFISQISRATDEEISKAIDVIEHRDGHDKARITACKRELRKRGKYK